jgi:hypothetical protein
MYLVTIKDKDMDGEPDIGFAVVVAANENEALLSAEPDLQLLRWAGRCRCVARAKEIDPKRFYRTLTMLRPPNAQLVSEGAL